jgi:hypothetical protein
MLIDIDDFKRKRSLRKKKKKVLTKTSQRWELLKTGALFFLLNSPLLATRTDDLIATSVKQSDRFKTYSQERQE